MSCSSSGLGSRMESEKGNGVFSPALESFVAEGKMVIWVDFPGIDPKDVEVSSRNVNGRRQCMAAGYQLMSEPCPELQDGLRKCWPA